MASSFVIPAASIAVLVLLFSHAPAVAGIVTDADGEELFNGRVSYYIVPSTPNVLGSGALSWIPNNSSTCPLLVKSKGNSVGTVASISWPARVTWVPTSTFVTIAFHDTNAPCSEPQYWSVSSNDDQLYVTAGDSPRSLSSIRRGFQIEEADAVRNEFYINSCLYDTSINVDECNDVGFSEDGLLVISPNKPVPFRFVKALSDIRMPVNRA